MYYLHNILIVNFIKSIEIKVKQIKMLNLYLGQLVITIMGQIIAPTKVGAVGAVPRPLTM